MPEAAVARVPNALPAASAPPPFALRRWSFARPRAIVVGASTGGPQALTTFLRALAPSIDDVPVVIVLHMPPAFVASMCADIAHQTGLPVAVAQRGEPLRAGCVFFAAGPAHCVIARSGEHAVFAASNAAPVNFCKPAIDVLFRSAADVFGIGTLGVVLTGMGQDGLVGSRAIVAAGGTIVAQDEDSSAVWGMPGAVARDGLCTAVLPPDALASTIMTRMRRFRGEHFS